MFGKENVKRISLAYQDLKQVPTKILRSECGKEVEELDLTKNKIRFLLDLPKLHTLIIDHNGLTSHVKFPDLPNVRILWVNQNNIENLGVFITSISKSFPNLEYLSMMKNDAAPSYFNGGTYMQYKDYRHYVISQMCNLAMLDDTPITPEERSEAERIYAALMPGWQAQVTQTTSAT